MLISSVFKKEDMQIFSNKFLQSFDVKDADSNWAYNKLQESIKDIDKAVEIVEANPRSYIVDYVIQLYEDKKLYVHLLSIINFAEEHHKKEILSIIQKIKEIEV